MNKNNILQGVILWGTKNIFYVLPQEHQDTVVYEDASRVVECRIKGKRQYSKEEDQDLNTYCTASDNVEYNIVDTSTVPHKGLITKRLPRNNQIVRSRGGRQHVVAVNMDILGIIVSVDDPPFRPRFIDRLLCIALQQGIEPIIIVNKIDIWSVENRNKRMKYIQERLKVYENISCKVIYTSMKIKQNISEMKQYIAGKRCAFIGQSGVGKSTVVNELISTVSQRTGQISAKYKRGRHTTTRPTYNIGDGFYIIDTPGIRDIASTNITIQNIIIGYPEFLQFSDTCKVPQCIHYKEPHCNVKQHIDNGIHPERYESYIHLLSEIMTWKKTKWCRRTY